MMVRNASEVEAITVEEGASGVKIQWMLDEGLGAPSFAMRRFQVDPGGHTPFHTHPWEHEVYIISGQGVVVADGRELPLKADDAVLVAPEEEHQFRAAGDEPLVLLCLVPNGPATAR
jgi:quercetin dioxygenase-like cupin family protein